MNENCKPDLGLLIGEDENTTAIWRRGLDLLAKTVREHPLPVGELDLHRVAGLLSAISGEGHGPSDDGGK